MRINSIKYLLDQGVSNIWKNKLMAFASFCVLLVSLLLVGFSILIYANSNVIINKIEGKNEAIVFLKENVTDEQINEFQKTLEGIDNISYIEFYSKEQAYADLKSSMNEHQVLFDSLGDDNPLIDSFKIKIKNIENINDTIAQLDGNPYVESISAPYDFASILIELKKVVTIVFLAIIVALIIISMVIISNSTKASVFTRRKEISIMKYVGATNTFIRIPFFIEGMLTGMAAGIVALIITWLSYDSIKTVLSKEAYMMMIIGVDGLIPFNQIAFKATIGYILSGAFLGALGCVISTRKHLKV